MGDPRKKRKLYEKPKKLWDSKRIEEESSLREEFGLKNARELWRMQTMLRKIRREARRLLSKKGKNVEGRAEQLLKRVKKFLINKPDATLDDVLALTTRDILARRLESIILKKNFAKTAKQARQFIVHGHVAINGNKVTAPSYLTSFGEEAHVNWFKKPVAGFSAPQAEAERGKAEAGGIASKRVGKKIESRKVESSKVEPSKTKLKPEVLEPKAEHVEKTGPVEKTGKGMVE